MNYIITFLVGGAGGLVVAYFYGKKIVADAQAAMSVYHALMGTTLATAAKAVADAKGIAQTVSTDVKKL